MPSRQVRRLRAASDFAAWAYHLAGVSSSPVPESLERCFTHVIGEETPSEEHHSGVPTIRKTVVEHVANLHRRMPTVLAQLKLGECFERTLVGVSVTTKVERRGWWVLMADVADVKWRRIVYGAYRDYISR